MAEWLSAALGSKTTNAGTGGSWGASYPDGRRLVAGYFTSLGLHLLIYNHIYFMGFCGRLNWTLGICIAQCTQ